MEFATDTEDALTSGCEGAGVALIAHSLEVAARQLGERPQLFLHGGGSEALAPHLPNATEVATLVLEGLGQWARVETAA